MYTPSSWPSLGAARPPFDASIDVLDLASLAVQPPAGLPFVCDYRHFFPPVQQQGSTMDCVSYAVSDHLSALIKRVQGKDILGSHTFLDYLVRATENLLGKNNEGTYAIDAFKHLVNEGLCPQHCWPDGALFHDMSPHAWKGWFQFVPDLNRRWFQGYFLPQDPFYVASHHKATTFRRVPTSGAAVTASLANGFFVTFCVELTVEALAVGPDGIFPYMDATKFTVMGGHCMTVVGQRADGRFICRNQWSSNWGDGGYCYLPANFFDAPPPGVPQLPIWDLFTFHALAK